MRTRREDIPLPNILSLFFVYAVGVQVVKELGWCASGKRIMVTIHSRFGNMKYDSVDRYKFFEKKWKKGYLKNSFYAILLLER